MIVAITQATGIKLAEVGFLLILIAGVWLEIVVETIAGY